MKTLLESSAARSIRYLEQLPERSVAPDLEAVARLAELASASLPDRGESPATVLERLDTLDAEAQFGDNLVGAGEIVGLRFSDEAQDCSTSGAASWSGGFIRANSIVPPSRAT